MGIWCQVLRALRVICHLFISLLSETRAHAKMELYLTFIWLDFCCTQLFFFLMVFFQYYPVCVNYWWQLSSDMEQGPLPMLLCCLGFVFFPNLPLVILAKLLHWENSSVPCDGFPRLKAELGHWGNTILWKQLLVPWAKHLRSFFPTRLSDTEAVLGCDSAVWVVFPSCSLFICFTISKSTSCCFCRYHALVWTADGAKYPLGGRCVRGGKRGWEEGMGLE